jgi:hypothetical protein
MREIRAAHGALDRRKILLLGELDRLSFTIATTAVSRPQLDPRFSMNVAGVRSAPRPRDAPRPLRHSNGDPAWL